MCRRGCGSERGRAARSPLGPSAAARAYTKLALYVSTSVDSGVRWWLASPHGVLPEQLRDGPLRGAWDGFELRSFLRSIFCSILRSTLCSIFGSFSSSFPGSLRCSFSSSFRCSFPASLLGMRLPRDGALGLPIGGVFAADISIRSTSMRQTTSRGRDGAVVPGAVVPVGQVAHVVTRGAPGPGADSPTSIRADRSPQSRRSRRRGETGAARGGRVSRRAACPQSDRQSGRDGAGGCRQQARSHRRSAGDLAGMPVAVEIEQATPGSPLDARLCREQARALLDLAAHLAGRSAPAATASKGALTEGACAEGALPEDAAADGAPAGSGVRF